jgi:hypothetical protein
MRVTIQSREQFIVEIKQDFVKTVAAYRKSGFSLEKPIKFYKADLKFFQDKISSGILEIEVIDIELSIPATNKRRSSYET